ncbi:galactokinase family protein [Paenibacillus sp. 1781tsa1]|uniref:galactokinase n=1 Tax=Paenibacillus sp. 1781tsa1 TaxID=2953810 RepID=UPI00209CD2C4|nr:galactokinase family protein [Paenibacillus sp. 1781tsa1]MCP1182364.1 galactokinase [Paenibacillus sp. 1781tsa1]
MTTQPLNLIQSTEGQALLAQMYGQSQVAEQTARYTKLNATFEECFGAQEGSKLFSASGRSEIGGNHTDHNHGKVLAGSITLDTIAVAAPTAESVITFYSEGYDKKYVIDLTDLTPNTEDDGTTALIRGMAAGFGEFGYKVGGFQAYLSSNVFSASGVSSSASFEMLICTILNHFYNDGAMDVVTLAKIGQYAENHYWNKPSGLLDQMACAYGGLIAIDFENPAQPVIEPVQWDFQQNGYSLVIVNTGGNHADLTEDYAAVPNEMRAVAQALGNEYVREITADAIYTNLKKVREAAGDRAVLRALHFLEENNRVDGQVQALRDGRFADFLKLITASGNSSWKWLQNVYQSGAVKEQEIGIALALTENYLQNLGDGACRIHGGGFAGVILTILPNEKVEEYMSWMHDMLETPIIVVNVRAQGAVCLNALIANAG